MDEPQLSWAWWWCWVSPWWPNLSSIGSRLLWLSHEWMNPSWVDNDDDVGFRLGDPTYHPLGAPCYDPLMDWWTPNWVDDHHHYDGFLHCDLTCHPLGAPYDSVINGCTPVSCWWWWWWWWCWVSPWWPNLSSIRSPIMTWSSMDELQLSCRCLTESWWACWVSPYVVKR